MEHPYVFQTPPPDTAALAPQVSRLLEKAVQTVSRERYPQLWRTIDRLNSLPKASEKTLKYRRIRTRIWSVICLLLGIFLFLPGLMEPQELKGPLFMGAIAIGSGIGGLWRSRNRKKRATRYDEAAKRVLNEHAALSEDTRREISFSENEMTIRTTTDGTEECRTVPCGEICVFESADLFLIFTDDGVTLLQKQDLTAGGMAEFCEFLASHTTFFPENS